MHNNISISTLDKKPKAEATISEEYVEEVDAEVFVEKRENPMAERGEELVIEECGVSPPLLPPGFITLVVEDDEDMLPRSRFCPSTVRTSKDGKPRLIGGMIGDVSPPSSQCNQTEGGPEIVMDNAEDDADNEPVDTEISPPNFVHQTVDTAVSVAPSPAGSERPPSVSLLQEDSDAELYNVASEMRRAEMAENRPASAESQNLPADLSDLEMNVSRMHLVKGNSEHLLVGKSISILKRVPTILPRAKMKGKTTGTDLSVYSKRCRKKDTCKL
jgi:hypothetical protein